MAITFSNLGATQGAFVTPDTSSPAASSFETASWAAPAVDLIIAYVFSGFVGTPNTPTMSGNGITWTSVANVTGFSDGAPTGKITILGANAAGFTTGATTIDFGGQTQSWSDVMFAGATGVDLSGGVAAAFVASASATATGATGTVTLGAPGNSANRPIAIFHCGAGPPISPRADWTELDDSSNGRATQYRGDAFETTASATFTSSVWAGLAAEVKAALVGTGFQ